MSGRVRIWCLRHGDSQNVTARLAGVVPAAPLTERGHVQATAAARALAAEPIAAVYTSTALRARQTAHPIAAARGVPVHVLPELAEVGIGRSEGSAAVVGHVASLTIALDRLCALHGLTWGTPLPHAEPFLVERDGDHWRRPAWPTMDT